MLSYGATCKFWNSRNNLIGLNLENLLGTNEETQRRKLPSGLFLKSRRKSRWICIIWGKIKLDLSSLRGLRVRTCKPNKPLSPNLGFHHGVSSLPYWAWLRQYRKRAATFKGSEYHCSPESDFVGYEDEWCCNQMCNWYCLCLSCV